MMRADQAGRQDSGQAEEQVGWSVGRQAERSMLYIIWIVCPIFFLVNVAKALEYHHNPRITLTEKGSGFRKHSLHGTHTRTELLQGPHEHSVYVGGHRKLFYIDFQTPIQSKEVTMFENECRNCKTPGICEYDITILHSVRGGSSLFVCGTNGVCPMCCHMSKDSFGSCFSHSAEGKAPFSVKERAPSLYIVSASSPSEDELYTTANLYAHGDGASIRRHFGKRGKMSSVANKTEQSFVAMVLSGPRAEPLQDRIYTFLVERNLDRHPEADPWVSRVIQVCKADRGGTKSILERLWTSLLSARLSCGIPKERLRFSHLLDVAVLQAHDWRDSRVYALFTNGWGMTAVCVYTMGTIDHVFMNSTFKNDAGPVPKSRPRMCIEDSRKLSGEELRQIKDYQEIEDWVRPVNNSTPLMVSHRHYRHIRADRVIGRGQAQHTVLLLSLESGVVHKVLEQAGQAFVIAELQPFRDRTHIQNMLLQPSTKKLYVSSSSEVVELDLRRCQTYGPRCEDCVLARDPYCGWDGTKCTAASGDTIQDVEHGNYTACEKEGETDDYIPSHEVNHVLLSAKFYLQCPILSSQAKYSWSHGGVQTACLLTDGQCLLLIEKMSPELEGNYSCVFSEGGYERTLATYELQTESKAGGLVSSLLASAFLLVPLVLLD
ncbi:hypothetical protein AAFF_G00268370 [Aldrovandia affinis]|uniref:Semaphorin-7A-like n=1 Tax=Aldrovandia affinis TaxID=143900 RepID=A0AAD7STC3_9TELE|nr:hypothetical protein AAFF_G00268370 [Aldrovandia affinis]